MWKFSRLNNLKACEQLNKKNWIEACHFWKKDFKIINHDINIVLSSLNVNIYLYQEFAIWWMFWQERTQTDEEFIDDKMSLKKIYIILIIIKWKTNYYLDTQNNSSSYHKYSACKSMKWDW